MPLPSPPPQNVQEIFFSKLQVVWQNQALLLVCSGFCNIILMLLALKANLKRKHLGEKKEKICNAPLSKNMNFLRHDHK